MSGNAGRSRSKQMQQPKANVDLQRADVLDAAARLFAKKGFHATGMRELAAHLQIKAGSLYYHIQSKDQLLNEICEIGMQRLSSNIDRAIAANSSLPDIIRSIVVGHAELIKDYGSYLDCYQNEYIHLAADVRERMRLRLVAFHHEIDDVFKRAIAKAETRPDLVVRDARLAVISILQQLSRLAPEHTIFDLERTAAGLTEILIYGLARQQSSQPSGVEACPAAAPTGSR